LTAIHEKPDHRFGLAGKMAMPWSQRVKAKIITSRPCGIGLQHTGKRKHAHALASARKKIPAAGKTRFGMVMGYMVNVHVVSPINPGIQIHSG
jgi:hypothetical protein